MRPLDLEPCIPPLWANSAHAQTVLGHLLPSPQLRHKGKRVEIPLEDGDKLVGFIQDGTTNTIVYVFHGLAGSIDSSYMHRTAIVAQKLGHTVFLANHRGCGEGAGLAKGPYHSGRGEDLSEVIGAGRTMYPHHRHVAIGFSMSGNALLLLLCGKRGRVMPDAGIVVNAPIHLAKCAELLRQGFNRVYDAKFYLQCRRDVFRNGNELANTVRIPRLNTLYEFDKLYTAPAGGFKNREDYYSSCSTYNLLDRIDVPTIIFTAKDDPFVPFECYATAKISAQTQMHAEEIGGHMGYLTRTKTPLGGFRWQDYAIHGALKAI